MTFDQFFRLCCTEADVEPTSRQRKSFLKGTGSAYAYAKRTGNRKRGLRLARREGLLAS